MFRLLPLATPPATGLERGVLTMIVCGVPAMLFCALTLRPRPTSAARAA